MHNETTPGMTSQAKKFKWQKVLLGLLNVHILKWTPSSSSLEAYKVCSGLRPRSSIVNFPLENEPGEI